MHIHPINQQQNRYKKDSDSLYAICSRQIEERELQDNDISCIAAENPKYDPLIATRLSIPIIASMTSHIDWTDVDWHNEFQSINPCHETDVYFYHSDLCGSREQSQARLNYAETEQSVRSKHLGSAAYLTYHGGVIQTLNYLPYGEDWVEYNFFHPDDTTRLGIYRFNGKEKDYESGFHYYGARYYWSEVLTGWLSVDALTDSFPNLSSYSYCRNNPVKLVEPDGNFPIETIWDIGNLVYDIGAAVVNHVQGNHSQAASHWADAAMDAAAVAIPYAPAGVPKVVRGTNSAVKSFNTTNLKYIKLSNGKWSPTKYRQNLQKYTGKEGTGCHAHHTLPKNQELKNTSKQRV